MKPVKLLLATSILMFSTLGFASGGLGTNTDSDYNIGKNAFKHKLYCQTCPLEKKQLDSEVVGEILDSLSTQGELASTLTDKERLAVIHFLKKRFNIL
ncbi:MAG: hypothetical protein GKR96_00330 [Gammaproteobacteria bacterium]|nr:hypothetical protein [Gammaproteobacteria bacterium]